MLKLNLGCGYNKLSDFVNIDNVNEVEPDQVVDLEQFPWPWVENSVDTIVLCHVLEHLGESTKDYFKIWQEMYRILIPSGRIHISVPHWLHENFAHDPTHIRRITPEGLCMFDHERNQEDLDNKGRESKLGWQLGIDFRLVNVGYDLRNEVRAAISAGEVDAQQVMKNVNVVPGLCEQIHIIMEAVKPARGRKTSRDKMKSPGELGRLYHQQQQQQQQQDQLPLQLQLQLQVQPTGGSVSDADAFFSSGASLNNLIT